jgi:putative ABC transport system ATP-binding protein
MGDNNIGVENHTKTQAITDTSKNLLEKPFIKVVNLRKVYRIGTEKVVALDNINLEIQKGEVTCLLGTSGSGKSTLLNMLAGLEKPTRGQIIIEGKHIEKMSESKLALFRQKYFGFVFQSYNLLPALTAQENVAMPMIFMGVSNKKRDKAAKEMLTQVGLGDRLKHKPTQMSGGQQQRVGIARAFVTNPEIVFADEPTGNLDSKTTIEVMEIMVNRTREKHNTLIVVTHDLEIAQYADRIIYIKDGNISHETINRKG